jgi:hypothetical protein
MTDAEKMAATVHLQGLLADYWHDVDTNWGRNAGDYYTEDAIFETSTTKYTGRAMIQEFYQYRLNRGPRVAVHAFTNFRVAFHDDTHATSTWYLHLYAHDGEPILPAAPPIQIALMTDKCLKGHDGKWRYTHRLFRSLFEGGVPTTSPVLDKTLKAKA